jgi:hypothetical protein
VSLEEECLTSPALQTINTTTAAKTVTSNSPLNFPKCVRAEEDQRTREREPLGKKAEKRKAAEEPVDTFSFVAFS